nr:hypothetical protein [uncultured Cohaesibacter sp.]
MSVVSNIINRIRDYLNGRQSVSSVTKTVDKMIANLNYVAAKCTDDAKAKRDKVIDLRREAFASEQEAAKATNVAAKLNDLVTA